MSDDLKKTKENADIVVEADAEAKEELDMPLATLGEVFSFAETTRTKVYVGLGVFWAMIAGLALPASIFYFARIMGNISAIGEEGLGPVLEIIYALMILGVVSLISETLECKYEIGRHRDGYNRSQLHSLTQCNAIYSFLELFSSCLFGNCGQ
jgi:hypothetical protein